MGLINTAVVVDDLEEPRNSNARVAERRGLTVERFADLDSAEAFLLTSEEPLLLILDHNFEGDNRTGFDLCALVREKHPFGLLMPIVYVSGMLVDGDYVRNQQGRATYGPTVFLPKQSMSDLGEVITNLIAGFDELWRRAIEQASFQVMLDLLREDDSAEADR